MQNVIGLYFMQIIVQDTEYKLSQTGIYLLKTASLIRYFKSEAESTNSKGIVKMTLSVLIYNIYFLIKFILDMVCNVSDYKYHNYCIINFVYQKALI